MAHWPKPSCGPFRLECDVLLWVRRVDGLQASHIQLETISAPAGTCTAILTWCSRSEAAVQDPEFTLGSGASGVAAGGAPGSVCN